jgi:hypothetical protein
MSRYSPESDVLVTVDSGVEVPGRAAGIARLAAGLAVTLILFAPLAGLTAGRGLTAGAGLAAVVLGLATTGLAAVLGLALPRGLAVVAVRAVTFRADEDRALAGLVAAFGLAAAGLAAVRGLAAVFGLAAALGFAVVFGLATVRALATVRVLAAAFGLAARFGAAFFDAAALVTATLGAAGLAADMVFAATVSALEAMIMALVAAFIARRAVDIVLADEVALVAAAVIWVAAEVTFAAAEETVLAAATVVGAVLAAAGLALTRLLGLAATERLLVARRIAPVRLVRARAVLAEPRRTALRAVDCRGIDLPPVVINYGGPIPRLAATYTPAAPEKTLTCQLRAVAATAETTIDGKRCKRPGRFMFAAGRP